ncbi:MAG: AMP-binding protein, partial [Pseudomonadota bacterium]
AAVPVNAKLHAKEAAWIVEHAGASVVFASDDVGDPLRAVAPACVREILSPDRGAGFAPLHAHDGPAAPHPLGPTDLAWLFYTSGTTGRPKGVMLTATSLQAMTLAYGTEVARVGPRDPILYAAPMSHGAGIYNFMHVLAGAPHVAPESGGFDAAEILTLAPGIETLSGGLSMFAAPTMVRRLTDAAKRAGDDQPGRGLKTVVYAGGPMYRADIEEAVALMGPRFVQIYGQGEYPMALATLSRHDVSDRRHPRWRERLGSVGRAQCVTRLRIADPEGREPPMGETGEILAQGLPMMRGYWRDPEATAKTIRDGWLWTGDMGSLDADGYLTLKDRSKDMIISGGSNIYPREIEEVLLTRPEVHEAAVVGRPHVEWGEEVVAFIVAAPGAPIDPAALDRHCLEQIARFKRPKAYRLVDALPKNNYGKVLKTALRDRLADEEPGGEA